MRSKPRHADAVAGRPDSGGDEAGGFPQLCRVAGSLLCAANMLVLVLLDIFSSCPDVFEHGKHLVRRFEAAWSQQWRLHGCEDRKLFGRICAQIYFGALEGRVAEPKRDLHYVMGGREGVHCAGVAQHVQGMRLSRREGCAVAARATCLRKLYSKPDRVIGVPFLLRKISGAGVFGRTWVQARIAAAVSFQSGKTRSRRPLPSTRRLAQFRWSI